MDFNKDYYQILGLDKKATQDDIKKSYRALAKKYHPDVNGSEDTLDLFNSIHEAYEVLSNERSRDEYDTYRDLAFNSRFDYDTISSEEIYDQETDEVQGSESLNAGVKIKNKILSDINKKILILSIVMPGFFQIYSGEKKLGYILFLVYYTLWVLAITQNLIIAFLALIVWAYSIFDAYKTLNRSKRGGSAI